MTEREVTALLASINDFFRNDKTTKEQAKNRAALWYAELKDVEATTLEVVQATRLYFQQSSFYPLPADVIKLIPRARIVIAMADERKALASGQKLITSTAEDATAIVERVLTDLYGEEVLNQ